MSTKPNACLPNGSTRGRRPGSTNERGVSFLWFTLFLLFSLGFIALGIDVAKLTATRTQLQNAADAAALAAASAVNPQTGQLDVRVATTRAMETGSLNRAYILNPEATVVLPSDVTFPTPNSVEVAVNRSGSESMVTHIAQVIGIPALQVKATAVALAETSSAVPCVLPIGVVLTPGEAFDPGCGNHYTLKYGPGSGSRGNYGYINLDRCPDSPCQQPGSNPNQIACLIENGYCCGMKAGDLVTTAPGNKGPALDGIDSRFQQDSDSREDICYSEYHGNGKRVVTVPVLATLPAGVGTTSVSGFASFFLQSRPDNKSGGLTGEFIYISTAGSGGGKPIGGAVTYSAHLVK